MYKIVLTYIMLSCSLNCFSQNTYFKMPNGKIIDNTTYEAAKENLSKSGKVEENVLETHTQNDSIIKTVKLTILTTKDASGNYYDPYKSQKELVGRHFPIEKFKKSNGRFFDADELTGKPTLINFWFTSCPPCIQEIPLLNELELSFKERINFLSITFDTEDKVNKFLKDKNIRFNHITDAKQQLKLMGIEAYPMNFIIDKFGNVVNVYGEISFDYNEINSILKGLLQ